MNKQYNNLNYNIIYKYNTIYKLINNKIFVVLFYRLLLSESFVDKTEEKDVFSAPEVI